MKKETNPLNYWNAVNKNGLLSFFAINVINFFKNSYNIIVNTTKEI